LGDVIERCRGIQNTTEETEGEKRWKAPRFSCSRQAVKWQRRRKMGKQAIAFFSAQDRDHHCVLRTQPPTWSGEHFRENP
jgi:hypothetical protein